VSDPEFLDVDDVLALHERQIAAFHIAQNQPFLDGHKRTGLGAALVFLRVHGFRVVDPGEALYEAMVAIAERRLDEAALAVLLERLAQPVSGG
jgi:death-on-curing protein